MYLVKTDSLGNKEWETFIGEKGKDIAFDIIETSDGSLWLLGHYPGFTDIQLLNLPKQIQIYYLQKSIPMEH